MTAAIITRPIAATRTERLALRAARALTAWVASRAAHREARHAALLARLHACQTRPLDPRATDYALARSGLPIR